MLPLYLRRLPCVRHRAREMAATVSQAYATTELLMQPPSPPTLPPPGDLLVSATTAVQVGLGAGSLLVLVPVASVIALSLIHI